MNTITLKKPLVIDDKEITAFSYDPDLLKTESYDRIVSEPSAAGQFRMLATDYALHEKIGVAILIDSNPGAHYTPADFARLAPADKVKLTFIGANFIMESLAGLTGDNSAAQ